MPTPRNDLNPAASGGRPKAGSPGATGAKPGAGGTGATEDTSRKQESIEETRAKQIEAAKQHIASVLEKIRKDPNYKVSVDEFLSIAYAKAIDEEGEYDKGSR